MNVFDKKLVVDTAEATQKLKEILQLGKQSSDVMDPPGDSGLSSNGKAESTFNLSHFEVGHRSTEKQLTGSTQMKQDIVLSSSDERVSFPVFGSDVVIKCSKASHTSSSSKVKIRNIVNSGWENRYYVGQQVAIHLSRKYIAYAIKIPTSPDGAVRVIARKGPGRVLLRGMKRLVTDLAFAHTATEVVLASVDEYGNLFVHSINEENGNLTGTLIFELRRPDESRASGYHRVIWCPYVPDDNCDEDAEQSNGDISKVLVIANHSVAEIWNIETVIKEYGPGPHTTDSISIGFQQINEHSQPISDGAFPPDGTALATVAYDGAVKFFQVSTLDNNQSQRCLHQWFPHNEKPLSSLFFLDNVKNPNPEVQFWKFAITGANRNRELKVWNCSTWDCLQTISFEMPAEETIKPELKAGLDESAGFLVLSDVTRRMLYILQIFQDPDNNLAQITSISQFHLAYPILSFAILEAGFKKFKQSSEIDQVDESPLCENMPCEMEEDGLKDSNESYVRGVVVKLVSVLPKSLQECCIAFQTAPTISRSADSFSSLSHDTLSYRDQLSDVSFDAASSDFVSNESFAKLQSSLASSQNMSNSEPIPLTPDDFSLPKPSSPLKNEFGSQYSTPKLSKSDLEQNLMSLEDPLMTSLDLKTHTSPSYSMVVENRSSKSRSPSKEKTIITPQNIDAICRKSVHSTGSSPSMEVEEILTKDFDENGRDSLFIVDNIMTKVTDDSPQEIIEDLKSLTSLRGNIPQTQHTSGNQRKSASPLPASSSSYDEHYQNLNSVKWPSAPKPPVHSSPARERSNEREVLTSATETNAGIEEWLKDSEIRAAKNSDQLDTVMQSMQRLVEMMESQKMEIAYLKQNVTGLKTQTEAAMQSFNSGSLQSDVNSSIKTLLQKHRQAETITITNLFKLHEDRVLSALSQLVDNTVITRLDSIVKMEFRNTILPVMTRDMSSLHSLIHQEVTQRLATTDSLVRDNIEKLTESKSFLTAVSHSVSSSIQGMVRSIFQEVFQVNVMPTFEKSCQNMFLQINDNFQKGAKEYMHHLESNLEKQRHQAQSLITTQLQSLVDNVHASTEQFTSGVTEDLDKQLQSTLKRFEEQLMSKFSTLIKTQMDVMIKEHQVAIGDTVMNAIKSRAVTPLPGADLQSQQAQIFELLQQGQINSAFQQALTIADSQLVIKVCQNVNPSQIFNESQCVLEQHVLLSLIDQLSIDLTTHTELKQDFLQEALVSLNFSHPVTSNYAPGIVETVAKRLQHFIETHPGHKGTRNMKLLLMAARSRVRS